MQDFEPTVFGDLLSFLSRFNSNNASKSGKNGRQCVRWSFAFAVMAGAAEREESVCDVCRKRSSMFPTVLGWKIHCGICQAVREARAEEIAHEMQVEEDVAVDPSLFGDDMSLPAAEDDVVRSGVGEGAGMEATGQLQGHVEEGGRFRFSPFPSEADFQLAKLFTLRNDLGKGMLQSFMRVSRHGPFVTKSADDLLKVVDSLPGLTFEPFELLLDGVDKDKQPKVCKYRFFSRSLVKCASWLLDRHGDKLVIPFLLEGPPRWVEELWEGERYQRVLWEFYRERGRATDVLVPLTLFSDETCLTMFNTMSDQSTTYPMFLTLGTLPKEIRRSQSGLVNVALLPKYLKRQHRGGPTKHAANKRRLTWEALEVILQELLPPVMKADAEEAGDPQADETTLPSFTYVSFLFCIVL